MLVEFEQNRMVQLHEILSFFTKNRDFKTVFDKALEDVSVA